MGKLVGFLLVLVVLAGAALGGGWFWVNSSFTAAGPATADGKPRIVMIERGASTQTIATKLKEAGAIADDGQFRLVLRAREFMGEKPVMKAGEFEIESGASMEAIVKQIEAGKVAYYAVIVPEGLTSQMIVDLLEREEWNTTNELYRPSEAELEAQKAAYAKTPEAASRQFKPKWLSTMKLAGPKPATPAEGVLLPGDYAVERGATIESVLDRMIQAQQKLLAEVWPNRQPGLPLKTPEDAVNLASVVQSEAGVASEQPKVASVFINRLNRPMRLESDPTIVYGISKGVPLGSGITVSQRARVTPWNTYQIDGLPKTPISNPGASAIRAVLNPPTTPYYFFVADGTQNHAYSVTYNEHLANVAKWREFEKQRDARKP